MNSINKIDELVSDDSNFLQINTDEGNKAERSLLN